MPLFVMTASRFSSMKKLVTRVTQLWFWPILPHKLSSNPIWDHRPAEASTLVSSSSSWWMAADFYQECFSAFFHSPFLQLHEARSALWLQSWRNDLLPLWVIKSSQMLIKLCSYCGWHSQRGIQIDITCQSLFTPSERLSNRRMKTSCVAFWLQQWCHPWRANATVLL